MKRWWLVFATVVSGGAQAASLSALVTDQNGSALPDAVIYAMPSADAAAQPSRSAIVDQVKKEFLPHVTPVQVGTAVSFPNKDNIRHHVYSFSSAKTFELKLYSGTPAKPIVFDQAGVVVLGCNIHDWMEAFIFVINTPHFAKSNASGSATISDLPSGEYELKAWHPDLNGGEPVQRIKIEGASMTVDFTLPVSPTIKKKPREIPQSEYF